MLHRRRVLSAAALAPLALLLPGGLRAQDAADRLIVPNERVGLVRKTTKPAALAELYGAANVAAGKVPGPEGTENPGAFVFKDKPEELRVHFTEDGQRIELVEIVAEKSPWKTREGIGIGMGVAEVEAINGRPFLISGFGWDLGGQIVDTRGGKLPAVNLTFSPTRQLPDAEMNRISGDGVKVASNHPLVRKAAPRVVTVHVIFRG